MDEEDETRPLLGNASLKGLGDIEVAKALQNYIPGTPEEKKLLRKIDLRLMPILWVMYILNYVDRTNIGNAKIAGMSEDLHLDDSRYAVCLSIFFIGYLVMEVPSNMLLSRSRPSIFLPGIMLVWGAFSAAMASIHTYQALLVFRFVLGCIEAGFFPGVLYLLSCWYTPTEIGKRFAVFLSAAVLAGAFGGLLAGAITGHLAGALRIDAWRWLFLIEGAATVVAAIVAKFILLDFPSTSLALSPEEAQLATIRLLAAGVESSSHDPANRLTHWQAFKAAALDYRTYLFMLLHVCEVGASTIHYFIPTITITLGYETVTAQYMTIPIYLVATICLNIAAFSGDRLHERRWHVTGAMAFGCITALVCVFNNNPVVRYVMLCFVYSGTWMAIPHVLAWTSETINMPAEKRSISLAIVNAVGNLSTVYGSTIWPSSTGPRYTFGWSVTAAFLASGAIIAALVPVILKASPHHVTKAERELQNKKKALGIQA